MAHENWRQVKEIFVDALRQTPEERPHFLDRVCSDDKTLRREVESLLNSLDSAESFLESPAVGEVVDEILTERRNFASGEVLGHYQIIKKIGTSEWAMFIWQMTQSGSGSIERESKFSIVAMQK